ncbi:MAG: sulfite exporter TauE/SafE family protein [Gallionella sp.]|nr:sulfite exporter TauE/SafE family protein [Gallionella sp.]MDP1940702.1 sulfite exporter TauE/SafE family protein [Gallionella sp.]
MEWLAAYLLLGACAGFMAGLFGVGGGTVLVPVLLLLFDAQHFPAEHVMHLALGTSMAVILFTSLASMRKHHQHNAVNWRIVRNITPGILSGAVLGALLAATIPTRGLGLFFALFLYFAALQILIDKRPHAARQLPGMTGMTLTGTFTGGLSSLVSIGGGTLIIPFLLWCNVPLRKAIGTSAAIGFPVAVGGTLGYIVTGLAGHTLPQPSLGFVYLPALAWVALASVLTAPLGAKATHHLKIGLLRKLFAVLLLALASNLLLKMLG